MPTRILYIITKGNFGGAQRYVFDLATHLSPTAFSTTVAAGAGDILLQKLSEKGVATAAVPELRRAISFFKDIRAFFAIHRLLAQTHPDIVHLNSSKAGGLGGLAARVYNLLSRRHIQIVFTAHGFAFLEDRSWYERAIIFLISALTLLFSTDIIFVSKADLAHAQRWFGSRQKFHYIPNGVETPPLLVCSEAREKLTNAYGVPTTLWNYGTVFVHIGELIRNKNQEALLEALQGVQDASLLLMGEGEDRAKLEAKVRSLHLEARVHFSGYVENASLYLSAFHALTLPSRKEGLPYVILEAGTASLPVVAAAIGGIPDIIEDGVSGLLVSHKAGELKDALQKLTNPKLRTMLGSALAERVRNIFPQNVQLKKTELVYTKG